MNKLNPGSVASYDLRPTTSEWDYSGRKERDGQKKKIVKATEKKGKSKKRAKDKRVNGEGERGAPAPCGAYYTKHYCVLAAYQICLQNCETE